MKRTDELYQWMRYVDNTVYCYAEPWDKFWLKKMRAAVIAYYKNLEEEIPTANILPLLTEYRRQQQMEQRISRRRQITL